MIEATSFLSAVGVSPQEQMLQLQQQQLRDTSGHHRVMVENYIQNHHAAAVAASAATRNGAGSGPDAGVDSSSNQSVPDLGGGTLAYSKVSPFLLLDSLTTTE